MAAQHQPRRLPPNLQGLADLVADVANLSDRRVVNLFRAIDAYAVEVDGLDPRAVFNQLDEGRLSQLADDPAFVAHVNTVVVDVQAGTGASGHSPAVGNAMVGDLLPPGTTVAYLSPEFGLAASLPQYSGGLGILAGDHLKAADDLGVPLVGVGLFYRRGYFRQSLGPDVRQVERFVPIGPEALGLRPVDIAPIEVPMAGGVVRSAVWQTRVGSVPLYLLDTAVDGGVTGASNNAIEDRLYGGDTEARIRQELLLGVGGHRLLTALGIEPDVFHLNEGHAGFLVLEAIRVAMASRDLTFDEAMEQVGSSVVFTTHTPVPAGIDRFGRDLVADYLQWWCDACGVNLDNLLAIGHLPTDDRGVFNMAALGLRAAGHANGVSRLHGTVSRTMFASLWPDRQTDDVPITSVTNGVHPRTWVAETQAALFDRHLGLGWERGSGQPWTALEHAGDDELWAVRNHQRQQLVRFVHNRVATTAGPNAAALDPGVLTIGFARRFATYKRATLLLRDPDRLRALLTDDERPVQFVFAGKAHPADGPGKEFVHRVAAFANDPVVAGRLVFVEDYDIDVGRFLTAGVDVWLNTPLRPMEACGTSGMKALLNGGLNCSVLDGWWAEFHDASSGWAIPTADHLDDPEARDNAEAGAVFDLLESEVVPAFYDRDEAGRPASWIGRMRRGLVDIGPQLTSGRMLREYVEDLYLPASRH